MMTSPSVSSKACTKALDGVGVDDTRQSSGKKDKPTDNLSVSLGMEHTFTGLDLVKDSLSFHFMKLLFRAQL